MSSRMPIGSSWCSSTSVLTRTRSFFSHEYVWAWWREDRRTDPRDVKVRFLWLEMSGGQVDVQKSPKHGGLRTCATSWRKDMQISSWTSSGESQRETMQTASRAISTLWPSANGKRCYWPFRAKHLSSFSSNDDVGKKLWLFRNQMSASVKEFNEATEYGPPCDLFLLGAKWRIHYSATRENSEPFLHPSPRQPEARLLCRSRSGSARTGCFPRFMRDRRCVGQSVNLLLMDTAYKGRRSAEGNASEQIVGKIAKKNHSVEDASQLKEAQYTVWDVCWNLDSYEVEIGPKDLDAVTCSLVYKKVWKVLLILWSDSVVLRISTAGSADACTLKMSRSYFLPDPWICDGRYVVSLLVLKFVDNDRFVFDTVHACTPSCEKHCATSQLYVAPHDWMDISDSSQEFVQWYGRKVLSSLPLLSNDMDEKSCNHYRWSVPLWFNEYIENVFLNIYLC